MSNFCGSCGSQLNTNASFCPKCGSRIDSKLNSWNNNYWGPRLFKSAPKKVVGRIHLKRNFRLFPNLKLGVRAKKYDWIPARKPF